MPGRLHVKKLRPNLVKNSTKKGITESVSVFFLCTNLFFYFQERKIHMICIFAVILIFLLPFDHAEDKMCVGQANEIGIYILYLI